MAKTNWEGLEYEFHQIHAKTGVKLQEWCDQRGLSYASARRYIKVRKDAQKKQKNDQNKVRKNAQKNESESSTGGASTDESHKNDVDENYAENSETKRKTTKGNPHPVCKFVDRNTAAVKHRGYAKYLDADELIDDAASMALVDELVFTRARALSVTSTLKRMFSDLEKAESVEIRVELYGKILQAEQALDRNIGRIESIERTLSTLDVYAATTPKILADTARIKAATAKLKAETDILTSQRQGVTTSLTSIVADVMAMNNTGRINDYPEE